MGNLIDGYLAGRTQGLGIGTAVGVALLNCIVGLLFPSPTCVVSPRGESPCTDSALLSKRKIKAGR